MVVVSFKLLIDCVFIDVPVRHTSRMIYVAIGRNLEKMNLVSISTQDLGILTQKKIRCVVFLSIASSRIPPRYDSYLNPCNWAGFFGARFCKSCLVWNFLC